MELIKVDKNGTEYYLDKTCRRCGGAGGAGQWAHTGYTCYRCGGSGIDPHPHIIKKHTPEYQAVLDAKKQAKLDKQMENRKLNADKTNEKWFSYNGFTKDGYTYVALGNTYDIKDELKAKGFKYSPIIGWHASEMHSEYDGIMMHANEICKYNDLGEITGFRPEAAEIIKGENDIYTTTKNTANDKGFAGAVGERVVFTVADSRVLYSKAGPSPWIAGADVHRIVDTNGLIYIWATASYFTKGDVIKATVKDNSTYKGESQTVITRGRVISNE